MILVCSFEIKPEVGITAGHIHGVTRYRLGIVKLWVATNRAKNIPSKTEVQHFLTNDTYRSVWMVSLRLQHQKKTRQTSNSTNDRVVIPRIFRILGRDFNTVHPKQIQWNSRQFDLNGSL